MRYKYLIVLALCYFFSLRSAKAYSILTHEAIIDVNWEKVIKPMLILRYPGSSTDQLTEAHSYAYGGAIMPDIGYSPFGSMLYTDFVHNVRTGDYITALVNEAQTLNEYAFALGSIAHFMADNYGHSVGTNVAVPLLYPKVKAEFGSPVTYADHHLSHSRTELSFDVLQTARGNYASKNYHDFIGFSVATPVVERAFLKTYGMEVKDIFRSLPVAISTYRWMIKSLLPNMVRTAWAAKKSNLKKGDTTLTATQFSYRMKNKAYHKEFVKNHEKIGFVPRLIGFLLPILPKVGPLAKFKFVNPTPEAEKLFIQSFETALSNYHSSLARIGSGAISFPNLTLDTGHPTIPGGYSIADDSYSEFILRLNKQKFANLNAGMKDHLLWFFSQENPKSGKRKDVKRWTEIESALSALKQTTVSETSGN